MVGPQGRTGPRKFFHFFVYKRASLRYNDQETKETMANIFNSLPYNLLNALAESLLVKYGECDSIPRKEVEETLKPLMPGCDDVTFNESVEWVFAVAQQICN